MKYFTIGELTHSDKAMTCHIDNTPFSQGIIDNMTMLIERLLDPIREAFGEQIYVNSGYRCPALNKAVGGAPNSQHLTGLAADITVGSKYDNMRLFNVIYNRGFMFDQLIDESDYRWLHISYDPNRNRRQILHK